MNDAIPATVAGTWYPGSPDELASTVDALLDRPPGASRGDDVRGLIVPHAGLRYSGRVAGRAFAAIAGSSARRVLLIGPSHHVGFDGLCVPEARGLDTPLGTVPIDSGPVGALARRPFCRADDGPFVPEHSLAMQLPFLQRVLDPGWRVVPVLFGRVRDRGTAETYADALAETVDASTVVVASSDLTHYGARFGYVPFHDRIDERIEELDRAILWFVEARDVLGFEDYVEKTEATVCGKHAIAASIRLLPEDVELATVDYDTSGRQTGDREHSVSYAAVVARRKTRS